MMNRRSFLKNTTIISGGVVIAPSLISAQSGWENEDDHLTILHTNDTHSNIEPFPENHSILIKIIAEYNLRLNVQRKVNLTKSEFWNYFQ